MAPLLNLDGTSSAPTAPVASDLIKDSDTQHFTEDVIEASKDVPIIVDFWAPWCAPCKQLGPMLERLVQQAGGLVKLVKINIDDNPQLAEQLRVESVPMVYGFKDGRGVDGFMGVQPESNIRVFIDRLTDGAKPPLQTALDQAQSVLDGGDPAEASAIYTEILQAEPGEAGAIAGLIRCLIAAGDLGEARAMADSLTRETAANSDVSAAVSALTLAEQGEDAGDLAELQSAVDTNPDDHQARFDLANALYAAQKEQEAIDALLELFKRDRTWNEEAARQKLVSIFEALGVAHPLTIASRRKLSSLMFS